MSHGRRIGRIKFIEPTPAVKERYFYRWNSKDLHFNPDVFPQLSGEGLFNSPSPINLEIGCGTGEYITGLAKSHPKENYVGIETSTRSVYFAIDLARKNRLENIRFIHGDFKLTYPLIPDNSIKTLILHFPDPNYGSKHIKHRIFDQNFLKMPYASIGESRLRQEKLDEYFGYFNDVFWLINNISGLNKSALLSNKIRIIKAKLSLEELKNKMVG